MLPLLIPEKDDDVEEEEDSTSSDKSNLEIPYIPPACWWQERWKDIGIKEDVILRNISYQIQYTIFLINLYNSYRIYLSVETGIFKNIIINITHIIEATLFYLVEESLNKDHLKKIKAGKHFSFSKLIGLAYHELELLDKSLWHKIHELRKQGNKKHLQAQEERELEAYSIDDVNEAIKLLDDFYDYLSNQKD